MLVTPSGMVIEVRPMQFQKVSSPMLVTVSGMVSEVRLKQRTFLDAVIQGIVESLFGYGKFGKSVLSLFGIAKFGGRGHYTSRSSYNDSHRRGGSCGSSCGGGCGVGD